MVTEEWKKKIQKLNFYLLLGVQALKSRKIQI